MTCGIYMIKNKQTGQMYIGQSIDINKRYHYHCCYGNYTSSYIDRAINKYGMNNFELIILEELDNNKDLLNLREQYWIDFYNTYNNNFHYNLTPGGDSLNQSDYVKKKISQSKIGSKHSLLTKNKMSQSHIGKKHTQEVKNKISKALSNKNHPMYNKKHTVNSCIKISKSHCNKTGYFRVVKSKSNTYRDGYYYRYSWRDGDKIKSICAPSLDKLERKVKREGYIWRKL